MARSAKTQPTKTAFSRWFDRKLEATRIRPTQLAASAGVSAAYVSMLRCGRRSPTYDVVEQLAIALGARSELDEALAAAGLRARDASEFDAGADVNRRHARRLSAKGNGQIGSASAVSEGLVNSKSEVPIGTDAIQPALTCAPQTEPGKTRHIPPDTVSRFIATMIYLLTDSAWGIRRQAGLQLVAAISLAPSYMPLALPALQRAAAGDPNPEVRKSLTSAIALLGRLDRLEKSGADLSTEWRSLLAG